MQSNFNTKKMCLVFALIILFFISFANSSLGQNTPGQNTYNTYSNFEAQSANANLLGCTCTLIKDYFTITNTGNKLTTITLIAQGDNADWSTYTPQVIRLIPGQSVTSSHFINPTCGVSGQYSIDTKFVSDEGITKTLSQNIDVSNCLNIELYTLTKNQSACSCSSQKYDFVLKNIGPYVETYDISISPFENSSLYPQTIILKPSQSTLFSVTLNPPCTKVGNLNYIILAKARTSGYLAKAPIIFNALQCNDFSLSNEVTSLDGTSIPLLSCLRENTFSTILVDNKGVKDNTYIANLYGQGSSFAKLGNNSLFLSESENGDFNIILSPTKWSDSNKGNGKLFNLQLNVTEQNGHLSKSIDLPINVTECYNLEARPETLETTVCCGKNELNLYVKNTGIVDEDVTIISNSYNWTQIKNSNLILSPNEEKFSTLIFDAPCNEKSSYKNSPYDVIFNVTLANQPTLNELTSVRINVLNKQQCYELSSFVNKAKYYFDQNQTSIIFQVQNKGIKSADYSLSMVDMPYWVDLVTPYISLNASQIGNVTLMLYPNESLVDSGKYPIEIKFNVFEDNASYTLPFKITIVKKIDVFAILLNFVENNYLYLIIIIAIILIIWLLNKIYVSYKTKELTKKILKEQEKTFEEQRINALSPKERRMEKLKLANEKRRAEKLATKKEEEQRKTDKKILRFVRFGGIILVIFLIALLLFAHFSNKYGTNNPKQTTILEDIKLLMGELKDFAISPFESQVNNSTQLDNTITNNNSVN